MTFAGVVCVGPCAVDGGRSNAADPVTVETPASDAGSGRTESTRTRPGNAVENSVDVVVSEEQERTALAFAELNHPELAKLLARLRKSNAEQFQKALAELSRDAERLNRMAERDSERHAPSLRLWKLDSQIRLQLARMFMLPDEDIESRLMPLIRERQTVRLQLLNLDRGRLADRLQRIEEQFAGLTDDAETQAASELARLKKSVAARSNRNMKPRTSNASGADRNSESDIRKPAEAKSQ